MTNTSQNKDTCKINLKNIFRDGISPWKKFDHIPYVSRL